MSYVDAAFSSGLDSSDTYTNRFKPPVSSGGFICPVGQVVKVGPFPCLCAISGIQTQVRLLYGATKASFQNKEVQHGSTT